MTDGPRRANANWRVLGLVAMAQSHHKPGCDELERGTFNFLFTTTRHVVRAERDTARALLDGVHGATVRLAGFLVESPTLGGASSFTLCSLPSISHRSQGMPCYRRMKNLVQLFKN